MTLNIDMCPQAADYFPAALELECSYFADGGYTPWLWMSIGNTQVWFGSSWFFLFSHLVTIPVVYPACSPKYAWTKKDPSITWTNRHCSLPSIISQYHTLLLGWIHNHDCLYLCEQLWGDKPWHPVMGLKIVADGIANSLATGERASTNPAARPTSSLMFDFLVV